jgi:hypothetical protein
MPFEIIALIIFGLGFAAGFGVRAHISHRRRRLAQERFW